MRKLAAQDSKNPIWTEDLRIFEKRTSARFKSRPPRPPACMTGPISPGSLPRFRNERGVSLRPGRARI